MREVCPPLFLLLQPAEVHHSQHIRFDSSVPEIRLVERLLHPLLHCSAGAVHSLQQSLLCYGRSVSAGSFSLPKIPKIGLTQSFAELTENSAEFA
jgi:hypothetical protein